MYNSIIQLHTRSWGLDISGQKTLNHVFLAKRPNLLQFYCINLALTSEISPAEYKRAAKELADKGEKVRLAMVNAMEESELAKKFQIKGFPTLKYFKHGAIPRDYQGPRKADVSARWMIDC